MAMGFRNPLSKSLASMIMPGDQPDYGMPPMPAPMGNPPEQSGGLFKPGSKGQIIAGIIGDTLASLSGGAPVFTQNMVAERQRKADMEASEAQWTRRRQAEREDKQWEWQNKPKDQNPYRFEDNAGNVWERGPDGQNKRIFTDMAPKQIIQDGMLITVPNPYNTGAAPAGAPTTIDEDLWNTGTPVGGPASAPGGFPRR